MFRLPDDFAAVGIARQIEELFGRQLIAIDVNVMLSGKLSPPLFAAPGQPVVPREKVHGRAFDTGLELFAERRDTFFRRHIVKELFEQRFPRLVQRLAVGKCVALLTHKGRGKQKIGANDKALGNVADDARENRRYAVDHIDRLTVKRFYSIAIITTATGAIVNARAGDGTTAASAAGEGAGARAISTPQTRTSAIFRT